MINLVSKRASGSFWKPFVIESARASIWLVVFTVMAEYLFPGSIVTSSVFFFFLIFVVGLQFYATR